jgi:DNA-directed RNA polymerase subunit M/transcription elongation factor TFIIS
MFSIPKEHDTQLLTTNQKKQLCKAINDYSEYYISDNRLNFKLKDNIELDKYLDIIYNITNSDTLLDKINNKELDIYSIPWLEPHNLDDKLWRSYIDRIERNRETKEKMATINIFKCRKCGEMKCTSYQLQTASIDEPMTTYISCKVCGHKWKV